LYAEFARESDQYQHLRRVHVQSTANPPAFLYKTFHKNDFNYHIVHDGQLERTLDRLMQHEPAAILPGTETGVELADALSARVGTPSNGVTKSSARRNKYEMIETVRQAGLNVADELTTDSLPVLLEWVESHLFEKIILKPLRSAGLDHVKVCRTADEIRAAFEGILGKWNKLGELNTAVLAQSFLDGVEYIVDTVSCEGRHYVTDVWQYERKQVNGRIVYDRGDLLPGLGSVEERLGEYVCRVLDALDIVYGPAHAEVMLTAAGPALVEIGARPCGAGTPLVCKHCIGYGQIDLGLDAYLSPTRFFEVAQRRYCARSLAMGMYFISNRVGRIEGTPGLDWVASLPDHFRTKALGIGEELQLTVDMITSPGIVEFVHPDKRVLDERYEQVRRFEHKEDFWKLVSDSQKRQTMEGL
jgi:biotin carboxylase